MCIIMIMNIYITRDNEEFLRKYSGSMSGLINDLLDDHRKMVDNAMYKPTPEEATSLVQTAPDIVRTGDAVTGTLVTLQGPVTDHIIPTSKPYEENLKKILDDGVKILDEPTYTDSEETA